MCNLCCKLMQTLERASPGCKVHECIDYGAIRVGQVIPGTVEQWQTDCLLLSNWRMAFSVNALQRFVALAGFE